MHQKINTMKVKISKEEIQKIVANPTEAEKAKVKVSDPWWVIALKVVAYLIGLLLAGEVSAEAATVAIAMIS